MMGRAPHQGAWMRASRRGRRRRSSGRSAPASSRTSRRGPSPSCPGGEQKRVAIARALAQEAQVLLLDEAGAHLDVRHAIAMHELVRREVAERAASPASRCSTTSTWRPQYADRVVLLKGGRLVADGHGRGGHDLPPAQGRLRGGALRRGERARRQPGTSSPSAARGTPVRRRAAPRPAISTSAAARFISGRHARISPWSALARGLLPCLAASCALLGRLRCADKDGARAPERHRRRPARGRRRRSHRGPRHQPAHRRGEGGRRHVPRRAPPPRARRRSTDQSIEVDKAQLVSDKVSMIFTEGLQTRFCGRGDEAVHTTFHGDVIVAIPLDRAAALPVTGTVKGVTRRLPPADPAPRRARGAREGGRARARVHRHRRSRPSRRPPAGSSSPRCAPASPADRAQHPRGRSHHQLRGREGPVDGRRRSRAATSGSRTIGDQARRRAAVRARRSRSRGSTRAPRPICSAPGSSSASPPRSSCSSWRRRPGSSPGSSAASRRACSRASARTAPGRRASSCGSPTASSRS